MSKVLLYSDPHIHNHKQMDQRLTDCLECLEWVFQTAKDRNVKDVICAGDLLHDRKKISVYAYHQVYKIFSKFNDLKHWLLLGNHDLWYYEKKDISSVMPFDGMPNVTVIDKPRTINISGMDFDFLPFTHDPISAITESFSKKSKVMIGHIAVDGAVLNFHHNTQAEVSIEIENDMVLVNKDIFNGYKRVFLGHYHGAQKLNNTVEYIGSLLQLTFGEAFQEKHIILLDLDDLSVEYIENTFSPKHFILRPEELSNYNLDGNFVRIVTDLSTDIIDVRTKIMENNPDTKLTFTLEKNKEEKEEKISKFNLAEGDTLERYIKTVGHNHLGYNKLLNLGKEICLEN